MSAIQTGISLLDRLISESEKYKIDLSKMSSVSIYTNMISLSGTFDDEIYNNLADAGFNFRPHDPGVIPHIVAKNQESSFMVILYY